MAYTTINKPSEYFNSLLWSGDGTTSNSITGAGFQPDFVWIKRRNAVAGHKLNDSVRGVNKQLTTNNTNAEGTDTNQLTSFDSDGFTLSNNADVNNSSGTYVGWNWLAGGSASSNTDGSITSSVSASTTSGFSIVSYTGNETSGATVGHGLSSVPNVIIVKDRGAGGQDWFVYHSALGNTKNLRLNGTGAAGTGTEWNNTTPSSSVFTLGLNGGVNGNSLNFIAYCFAEKKGFSKFGSYTGNGSTDGTFVYTGFKPAFMMWKSSSAAGGHWVINDNTRNPINQSDNVLFPNLSNAESTTEGDLDILSNGFKFRGSSNNNYNHTGVTYIYMAFAENPLVTSGGTPATAR